MSGKIAIVGAGLVGGGDDPRGRGLYPEPVARPVFDGGLAAWRLVEQGLASVEARIGRGA